MRLPAAIANVNKRAREPSGARISAQQVTCYSFNFALTSPPHFPRSDHNGSNACRQRKDGRYCHIGPRLARVGSSKLRSKHLVDFRCRELENIRYARAQIRHAEAYIRNERAVVDNASFRTRCLVEAISKEECRLLCLRVLEVFPQEIRDIIYQHIIGASELLIDHWNCRDMYDGEQGLLNLPCAPLDSLAWEPRDYEPFENYGHLWDIDSVGAQFREEFLQAFHCLVSITFTMLKDRKLLAMYIDEATAKPTPRHIFTTIFIDVSVENNIREDMLALLRLLLGKNELPGTLKIDRRLSFYVLIRWKETPPTEFHQYLNKLDRWPRRFGHHVKFLKAHRSKGLNRHPVQCPEHRTAEIIAYKVVRIFPRDPAECIVDAELGFCTEGKGTYHSKRILWEALPVNRVFKYKPYSASTTVIISVARHGDKRGISAEQPLKLLICDLLQKQTFVRIGSIIVVVIRSRVDM